MLETGETAAAACLERRKPSKASFTHLDPQRGSADLLAIQKEQCPPLAESQWGDELCSQLASIGYSTLNRRYEQECHTISHSSGKDLAVISLSSTFHREVSILKRASQGSPGWIGQLRSCPGLIHGSDHLIAWHEQGSSFSL